VDVPSWLGQRVIKERADIVVERALIALEGEGVSPPDR